MNAYKFEILLQGGSSTLFEKFQGKLCFSGQAKVAQES